MLSSDNPRNGVDYHVDSLTFAHHCNGSLLAFDVMLSFFVDFKDNYIALPSSDRMARLTALAVRISKRSSGYIIPQLPLPFGAE
jgi:hypothetical protein